MAYILQKAALKKVSYVPINEFPLRVPPVPNIAPRFFHYKLEDWNYEKEWRFIHPNLLQTSDADFDSLKKGFRFIDFVSESIESIFLGLALEAEQQEQLLSVLNNRKNLATKVIKFSGIDKYNDTFISSHKWVYDQKEQRYVSL